MIKPAGYVHRLQTISSCQVGDYHLDVAARKLWVAGREVALSPLQVLLVAELLTKPCSLQYLWQTVWGYNTPINVQARNTVDVNLHYLRRHLGARLYGQRSTGWQLI